MVHPNRRFDHRQGRTEQFRVWMHEPTVTRPIWERALANFRFLGMYLFVSAKTLAHSLRLRFGKEIPLGKTLETCRNCCWRVRRHRQVR
jgi:hypothetical protein